MLKNDAEVARLWASHGCFDRVCRKRLEVGRNRRNGTRDNYVLLNSELVGGLCVASEAHHHKLARTEPDSVAVKDRKISCVAENHSAITQRFLGARQAWSQS